MKFKFCGGCNPLYDRVALYNKIKNKEIEIDKSIELFLLNGCHRGCNKLTEGLKFINMQEFFITHSAEHWNEKEILKWIQEESKKRKE